jgi:Tfp pilus assembly protein PilF
MPHFLPALSFSRRAHLLAFSAFLAVAAPLANAAQLAPDKELSPAVSAQLPALRTLTEGKSFSEALRLIDSLRSAAAAGSYDAFVLAQIKAQVLLTLNDYPAAATALEQVVDEGKRQGYLDQKALLDHTYLLAQVYYQQAAALKEPASRRVLFERAYATLQGWFDATHRATQEARLFSADLLYNSAVADPEHIDLKQVAHARDEAEKSLRLQIKANPRAYVLILAALQQLGEREQSAEILELLVAAQPQNSTYWQQLSTTYLNLAAAAKTPADVQRHTLRAILAVERAQALGLLRNSRENLNLVALYFNLQRFDRATSLLEKGLENGDIESTRHSWEFLASAYQQSHQVPKALASLEKAVNAFPQDGQLEFTLAQILYSEDRPADTLAHLEKAVSKGGLDKPGQAHLFLGYVAFELQRYADAIRWTDAAARFNDAKKDDLTRLNQAAKIALAERVKSPDAKL